MDFAWMAWTLPTALFFGTILLMLLGMGVWEYVSPGGAPRNGVLGFETTRGDRLFIGLLSAAYLNLAWAGLTEMDQAIGAAVGFLVLLIVMRWG